MGKTPSTTSKTSFIRALLSRNPSVPIDAELKRRVVRSLQKLVETDAQQGAAAITELVDRIKELQDENETLRTHAMVDALTTAYNTRYFNAVMDELTASTHGVQRRPTQRHFIMTIDLDKFKAINDTYGHACGDQALTAVVEKLKAMTRKSDIVCRVGGDEFVLILKNSTLEGAQKKFSDIIDAFKEMNIDFNGTKIPVRASMGWAEIEPDSFAKEILQKVDERMYEDKKSKITNSSSIPANTQPTANNR